MKNRVRFGASFALCILLAVPAYAEQGSQWKLVNHYLDKAEKGTYLGI